MILIFTLNIIIISSIIKKRENMYKRKLFAISAIAMISSHAIAANVLDDVVVTAKSEKSISDLSGAVTVITAEDIQKLNATNIKDILVKTSGIIKTAAGAMMGGRESISIRGLDSTYSLILVDGKRINPTDNYIGHSDFQYSWVPINMIEKIEIMKGAKSSIYGSSAIGGVINIITKKDTKKIYGEVDIEAGFSSAENDGDEHKISANIGGNISEKLYMFLGANKNEREATGGVGTTMFGTPTDEATYIEGIESKDAILKLKYKFDDTQSVSASYTKGEEERKDYKNDNPTYDLERDLYSVGYEKSFEDLSFSVDYAKAKQDSVAASMFANYTHALENDSIKGEAKLSMIKNNYIVLGAETSKETYERIKLDGSTQYSFDARSNAYYLQDEIEMGDFIFTLGGRFDDNQKYGSEFSPNAGLVYKIDANQRLKASYAEAFKAPSVTKGSDGFGSGMHHSPFGNDDLKAETAKSYELAYEFYGEDSIFKSAIFKTDVENMIKAESTNNIVSYENVNKSGTEGIELGLDYYINDNHSLNTNYTYVKTENKETGKELTYKPKHTLNAGISSEFEWGLSTYLSANYVGKQYTDGDNTNKVSGYTTVDIQASKKITDDFTVRLGVDNITDREFHDGDPYYLKRRIAYLGLNYKF